MTLKNNRAPLLSNIKPYASFHHHMWIQTGVTVRKRLSWVVTYVTLTFDLYPWPFAWTLLWSLVITPENFMMIRWWEHSQRGVTDGRTDGRTENTICRAAWSQLKTHSYLTWMMNLNSPIYSTLLQNKFLIWGLFLCIWDFGCCHDRTGSGSSGIQGEFESCLVAAKKKPGKLLKIQNAQK